MQQVIFSSGKESKNRRELSVEITPDGDLVFEGVDSGPFVKEWFGDYDYEYSLKVKRDQIPRLYSLLSSSDPHYSPEKLVDQITMKFGVESGFADFKDFLAEYQIAADSWSF